MSYGLSFGLIFGLSYGVSSGLIFGLSYGVRSGLFELSLRLSHGLPVGLVAGLCTGLLVGLLKGGLASFRHVVLRFLLWRTGSVPWHFAHFLDAAAERILLRKIGGGYIFIHRLLLEYFASLDSTLMPDEDMAQQQRVQPVP